MEANNKEKGIALGLLIIVQNLLFAFFIQSIEDIVRPRQGIKTILIGIHTQLSGLFCLLSYHYYNKSFVFRFWRRLTRTGFIFQFKNDQYLHFLFFFSAGTYMLLIGLGMIMP